MKKLRARKKEENHHRLVNNVKSNDKLPEREAPIKTSPCKYARKNIGVRKMTKKKTIINTINAAAASANNRLSRFLRFATVGATSCVFFGFVFGFGLWAFIFILFFFLCLRFHATCTKASDQFHFHFLFGFATWQQQRKCKKMKTKDRKAGLAKAKVTQTH